MSFTLLLSMVEFKARISRGELDSAMELLPQIPKDQHNAVARFLEAKGMVGTALAVATDPDYRFDLAVQLGDLEVAQSIAQTLDSTPKWKQLGEMALTGGKLELAAECLSRASDFSGLLMLASARGDRAGMAAVAVSAAAGGKSNVAFLAFFLLGRLDDCLNLLLDTNRCGCAAACSGRGVAAIVGPTIVRLLCSVADACFWALAPSGCRRRPSSLAPTCRRPSRQRW